MIICISDPAPFRSLIMHRKPTKLTFFLLFACGSIFLVGCEKEEETPIEELEERTLDALDARENEEIKDAAEDLEDAADNAADAVEEEVEEVSE